MNPGWVTRNVVDIIKKMSNNIITSTMGVMSLAFYLPSYLLLVHGLRPRDAGGRRGLRRSPEDGETLQGGV